MTLPEITKEENEKPKIKQCPDCGKPCKNLTVHQRYCKASKDKKAMKQETILNTTSVTPTTPAEPLIISDVQPYIGDNVAWFESGFEGSGNRYFIAPEYIGIVNQIPMVLVQFHDGAIIPPSLIPGFIGMFKEDATFDSKQDDDEPFPPFPEEAEEPKTLLEKIEDNHPDIKQAIRTEKPKSSWWPFSHMKISKPKTPKPDKTELAGLVEGAINATG